MKNWRSSRRAKCGSSAGVGRCSTASLPNFDEEDGAGDGRLQRKDSRSDKGKETHKKKDKDKEKDKDKDKDKKKYKKDKENK